MGLKNFKIKDIIPQGVVSFFSGQGSEGDPTWPVFFTECFLRLDSIISNAVQIQKQSGTPDEINPAITCQPRSKSADSVYPIYSE